MRSILSFQGCKGTNRQYIEVHTIINLNAPRIMISRNEILRYGCVRFEDALESLKIGFVSAEKVSTKRRDRMIVSTHSASDMESRPLSIISPRNTIASGFFSMAAFQFLRRLRSTIRRVRCATRKLRLGYEYRSTIWGSATSRTWDIFASYVAPTSD